MKKMIFGICLAGLLFTGCGDIKKTIGGDEEVSQCDNNTTFVGLQELVTDGAMEKMKAENPEIDIAKARATMATMKVSFDSVTTTKKDPNSSKVFCKGKIKITMPTTMLNDVEKGYKNLGNEGTFRNSSVGGFEANANNFIKKDVEYNTQPTDDGKEIYYGFDNQVQMDEIIAFYHNTVVFAQNAATKINESLNTQAQKLTGKKLSKACAELKEYNEHGSCVGGNVLHGGGGIPVEILGDYTEDTVRVTYWSDADGMRISDTARCSNITCVMGE